MQNEVVSLLTIKKSVRKEFEEIDWENVIEETTHIGTLMDQKVNVYLYYNRMYGMWESYIVRSLWCALLYALILHGVISCCT